MITTKGELLTTIIHNEDNTKTFEIQREFIGVQGEDIILLQLFPTLGKGDEFTMDSTTRHIISHREELNIKSIRFINLFATRSSTRMSTKNIEIDTENMSYIESIMQEKDFKKYRFVVAFGCTMQNCAVANETKDKIYSLFRKHNLNGKMYQITVDNLDSKNDVAVHVLFLGIRHSNAKWRFEEFILPKPIDEKSSKKKIKALPQKGKEKNVLQNKQ